MNKPLALAALATLPATLLTGCVSHSSNNYSNAHYYAVLVPLSPPSGGADVRLDTDFGDLDVAPLGADPTGNARKHYQGEIPDGPYAIAVFQSNRADRPMTATAEPVWNGSELTLVTHWPNGRNGTDGESTSYTVRLPEIHAVNLDTSFGDVEIAGATGEVDVTTQFGDVTLHDTQSPSARLVTQHGDVDIWNFSGPLQIQTSFGDIVAANLTGAVDAHTSHGDIELRLAPTNPGPFTAVTSFGDIQIFADRSLQGQLEMSTSFGDSEFHGFTPDGHRLRVKGDDHGSASVSIGQEGPRSIAQTSHGDIEVIMVGDEG